MAHPTTVPIRRWIVRITIGSFSLAALMGIIALLGSGDFGQLQGRVLLTTLLVGVVSIAVLCYLATAGRSSQPVGVAGGVVVLVPLASALFMIWGSDWDRGPSEPILRTFGVGAIVAATLAQASLLLAMGERARTSVRRLLAATLALAGLLALLTSVLVLGYQPSEDPYARVIGVVAILDVLGTVVVAALVKFGPSAATDAGATPGPAPAVGRADSLPDDLAASIVTYAAAHDVSPHEVVERAVRELLAREAHGTATGPRAADDLAG